MFEEVMDDMAEVQKKPTDELKEEGILNQCHLNRFCDSRAPIAIVQRGEKNKVVQYGIRSGEAAEKVLFAKGIDAVFYANAGIILS